MNKIIYDIEGLDCAHCAEGLAAYLSNCEGIETAHINFINKTLTVTYEDKVMSDEELLALALKGTDDDIDIRTHVETRSLKVKIFDKEVIINLIRIAVASILLAIGFGVFEHALGANLETAPGLWGGMLAIYIISYLLISYDYLWKFLKSFRHPTKMFNETVLMVVASIGAFAIQAYPEAVLVMILAQVGEIFEHISVNKSKNSIIDTIDTRPKMVTKVVGENFIKIPAEELKIGDVIVLAAGEVLPCDGKVVGGTALLDTSSVTGEFKPVDIKEGDMVMSGTVMIDGAMQMVVDKEFHNSTTSKILNMVMESSEYKSKAENFISKFANWYTPIVFVLALIIATIVPAIIGALNGNYGWDMWYSYVYTALTFLVISCPCAIVISVPLTYFVGTTLAFKNGIIVKGSNYLDRLNELSLLVSDKTGTLTTGSFSIKTSEKVDEYKDVFDEYVCAIESHSNHPIAKAIVHQINATFETKSVQNVHEMPRFGIQGEYKNHKILLGNLALMNENNVAINEEVEDATYMAVDGGYAGYIVLDDTIKENSKKAINFLSSKDIKTLMLTGGDEKSAHRVSKELGISEYKSQLLPEDKINYLKKALNNKKPRTSVAYIGDGINDAPSIILADIGVAMGGMGADAAVSNADIVLTNDDPIKIEEMIKIARTTRNRAIFNIVFALTIKLVVMILSLFSLIPMWAAVICDTGLSLFLVIVSILLIKKKIKIN